MRRRRGIAIAARPTTTPTLAATISPSLRNATNTTVSAATPAEAHQRRSSTALVTARTSQPQHAATRLWPITR